MSDELRERAGRILWPFRDKLGELFDDAALSVTNALFKSAQPTETREAFARRAYERLIATNEIAQAIALSFEDFLDMSNVQACLDVWEKP